jgi:large subunit ribosomal protein L25
MRKDITIVAEPRASRGKNAARRLRVGGRIPAVLYGAGKASTAITLDPKEIDRILYSSTGHNTIFDVRVDGQETCPAMIVDWQHDPIQGRLLHADLERIDLTKKLRVKVPVHTEGEPRGVKQQGGLMEVVTREIEIECLPDNIPEHLTVNVQDLLIGQNLRAADVPLGDGIELRSTPDTVICHVIALRTSETAAAPEAGAEPAEPEVVKKGKGEEKE